MTDDQIADLRRELRLEIRGLEEKVNAVTVKQAEIETTQDFIKGQLKAINEQATYTNRLILTTLISVVGSAIGLFLAGKIIIG